MSADDGYLYRLHAQHGRDGLEVPRRRPAALTDGSWATGIWSPSRRCAADQVVVDGVVYFGAGIWPIFGIFLHALDAETGKAKWTNGELTTSPTSAARPPIIWTPGCPHKGILPLSATSWWFPAGVRCPRGLTRRLRRRLLRNWR